MGLLLVLAVPLGLVCGCEENPIVTPPPPEVGVAQPVVRDVTRYAELSGRTEALQVVEVRARVEGVLLEAFSVPGSAVSKGDVLFRIDPDLFVAERDAAAARVQRAEAEANVARVKLDRIKTAAERGAANQIEVLEAEATAEIAAADLEVARRELAIKQLSVDYTEVRAPLSGEIEAGAPDLGSLVGGLGSGLLTRIYDTSSVHVWMTVPDRVFLETAGPNSNNIESPQGTRTFAYPIEVATEADADYPHAGVIDYVDPAVDPATGTIRLRATVPNPSGALKPGLFVRGRLVAGKVKDAILVPEAAIGSGQIGRYVLVLGEDDLVQARPVELGVREGPLRVIESGLSPVDRVIVSGILRARPGQPVTVREESIEAPSAESP
jgi:RND family efflux transporter MFP subunit